MSNTSLQFSYFFWISYLLEDVLNESFRPRPTLYNIKSKITYSFSVGRRTCPRIFYKGGHPFLFLMV